MIPLMMAAPEKMTWASRGRFTPDSLNRSFTYKLKGSLNEVVLDPFE